VATDIPSFDQLLDLLRLRLQLADDVNVGEFHSFKVLMADKANVVADGWYWDAFAELQAQGHLDTPSSLGNRGDAFARLSADGRLHLRTIANST
jgi:hypothetical protein